MSTHSSYRVIGIYMSDKQEKKKRKILNLYVQHDGYPEGHPVETMEWLSQSKVVNGLGSLHKEPVIFNGAECLAAQLVARLKDGPGDVYIEDMSVHGHCMESYLYDIIVDTDKSIIIRAYTNDKGKKKFFEGTPAEFVEIYKNKEK